MRSFNSFSLAIEIRILPSNAYSNHAAYLSHIRCRDETKSQLHKQTIIHISFHFRRINGAKNIIQWNNYYPEWLRAWHYIVKPDLFTPIQKVLRK